MKSVLLILLLIASGGNAFSQNHDYRKLRSSLGLLSCGLRDSTAIKANYEKLIQVDTLTYNRHLDIYFQDLAMACYKMSFITKDKSYLEKDASLLKRALAINPRNETARWNYLFALFLLKRCAEAKEQLTYYLSHTARAYIDTAQVRLIREHCR